MPKDSVYESSGDGIPRYEDDVCMYSYLEIGSSASSVGSPYHDLLEIHLPSVCTVVVLLETTNFRLFGPKFFEYEQDVIYKYVQCKRE